MLLYLIHARQKDKTQYDIEEVQGELKEELKKLMKKENRNINEIMLQTIELIRKHKINSITELLEYSINQDIYDEIKKSQMLLCKIIDENRYYKM